MTLGLAVGDAEGAGWEGTPVIVGVSGTVGVALAEGDGAAVGEADGPPDVDADGVLVLADAEAAADGVRVGADGLADGVPAEGVPVGAVPAAGLAV